MRVMKDPLLRSRVARDCRSVVSRLNEARVKGLAGFGSRIRNWGVGFGE